MSGRLLCLDGVDGGGKSTQVRLLCEWLESLGQPTISIRDPGGTKLGETLRDVLLHRQEIPLCMTAEMLLYMASRAQLVCDVIKPALESGTNVVADRFLLANVVYQGVAGGLGVDAVWQVGQIATAGLRPDLTVILDVDVETAVRRIGGSMDRLESRGVDYLRKVRNGFLEESKRLGDRAAVVDATQSIPDLQASIQRLIEPLIRSE